MFTEIGEQLPNDVGPSTKTAGTGTGSIKVMNGSVVANISVGTSKVKNR
jgi:hypothetical protein